MQEQKKLEPDENSDGLSSEQLNQQELNKLPGIDQSNAENMIIGDEFIGDEANKQIASKEEVRAEIERVFKEEKYLMTKLIKTAEAFLLGLTSSGMIFNINASDIVLTSIYKILDGRRKWYKNKCSNIVVLIIGVIYSEIRNILKSDEYKFYKELESFESENDENNNIYDIENGRRYNPLNPETDVDEEEFFQRILALFEDDPIAYCVLEELLSSSDYDVKEKNQLLAKILGIEVIDVENAKKRIKYRLQFLKKK